MKRELFEALMDNIVSALIERGYNPYAQIKGALLENEPNYITSHNGARKTFTTLDSRMVRDYMDHWDEYQDKKWRLDFVKSYH